MDNEREYEALRDETIPDLVTMIIALRTALRREKFAHGDFPTVERREAHERINAVLKLTKR